MNIAQFTEGAATLGRFYSELSLSYAHANKMWLAPHAIMLSDIHATHAAAATTAANATDPMSAFTHLADAVTLALDDFCRSDEDHADALAMSNEARARILKALPSGTVVEFCDNSHLSGLSTSSVEEAITSLPNLRLGGWSIPEALYAREQASRDLRAMSRALFVAGHHEEAIQQAWAAEWTAYDAYLIGVASLSGDETLATCEIHWDAAYRSAATLESLPSDLNAAVATIRETLTQHMSAPERQAALAFLFGSTSTFAAM